MVDTFPGVWSKVITMVNQQKRKTHKKRSSEDIV